MALPCGNNWLGSDMGIWMNQVNYLPELAMPMTLLDRRPTSPPVPDVRDLDIEREDFRYHGSRRGENVGSMGNLVNM